MLDLSIMDIPYANVQTEELHNTGRPAMSFIASSSLVLNKYIVKTFINQHEE